MGVIDKTTYTLRCESCQNSETASVLEHGSSYGSSWQSGAKFKDFQTQWSGGDKTEPRLTSSVCTKCHVAAIVQLR